MTLISLVSILGFQLLISHIPTPGCSDLSKAKNMPEPGPVYTVVSVSYTHLTLPTKRIV